MAATLRLEQPDEVANRVLRRAQVSKMTRALQDRLALANVKMQNGWENMSLDAIEPRVDDSLARNRPASSNETISDAASNASSRLPSSRGLDSSPLTAPTFSDRISRSGPAQPSKRVRPADVSTMPIPAGPTTGPRTRAARPQWKRKHGLPESSPIKPVKHARIDSNNVSRMSFVSDADTVPDDPPSPELSEDDDADLPVHSFSLNHTTRITSSPPRTPPPDRRMRKAHNVSWSRTPKTGEEGADLLIYLATSPSAANIAHGTTRPGLQPPTTPPCRSTPLPSSHMTPGTSGNGFMAFGPATPGTNFNFADFVNVTPSPAQGPWMRTPVATRTPGASARRRLNFDSLMPPGSPSPAMRRHSRDALGMDLGGELVS